CPLELVFEQRVQGCVRRGILRRGDGGAGNNQPERARYQQAAHSTLPIFFTTSASLCASSSQNTRNWGWSRYWMGVSTLASDDLKVSSLATAREASRRRAIAASGVPAGTNRPV